MAGFTYNKLVDFSDTGARSARVGSDLMVREGNKINVSYRGNVIATYNIESKKMTVTDAGWRTHTTKDRLNKIIPQGGVTQYLGKWYFERGGKMVPFVNDMDVTKTYPEAKTFAELKKSAGHEYRIARKLKELDDKYEKEQMDEAIKPAGAGGMTVNLSKLGSDDPLAFTAGFSDGIANRPLAKVPRGESLAPEYFRGWKMGQKKRREELDKMFEEARQKREEEEKKPSLFESKKAQVPLTMTKFTRLGSKGSGWHKEPISHSYATKFGKAPKHVRGR